MAGAVKAVDALLDARRRGTPVPAPAIADADEAYAVQAQVAAALGWFDGMPRHWKSGAPSRGAVQTHAALPPAGVWSSPAADARTALSTVLAGLAVPRLTAALRAPARAASVTVM